MNSTRFPGDRAVAAERRPGPRSRLYLRRHYGWFIEDFHKALKTGMGAERLQLEEGHRIFAAVAIMSVGALRLIGLREQGGAAPRAPAGPSGLGGGELLVLRAKVEAPLWTGGGVGP